MTVISRAYALGPHDSLWKQGPVPGQDCDLLVGGPQSEGRYTILRYRTVAATGLHVHEQEDESIYVLRGEPRVTVGDTEHALVPGSFLFMPRNVPHGIEMDEPWEGLSISAPGGIFDKLMEDLGEALVADGMVSPERMAEIMARHGVRSLDPDGRWYDGFAHLTG